jgi:hypothetical protein
VCLALHKEHTRNAPAAAQDGPLAPIGWVARLTIRAASLRAGGGPGGTLSSCEQNRSQVSGNKNRSLTAGIAVRASRNLLSSAAPRTDGIFLEGQGEVSEISERS